MSVGKHDKIDESSVYTIGVGKFVEIEHFRISEAILDKLFD